MATPSGSSLRSSLLTLSRRWPADKLRPALQFAHSLEAATNRVFAEGAPVSDQQLSKGQEMVGAVERLLANDALKSYPMSNKTLQPASFPKHYARMQDGIQRANRGEVVKGRTWREWFTWK